MAQTSSPTVDPARELQKTNAHEKKEGERLSSPSGKVVYAAILSEAREELRRPSSSLFFSGLAAGLSMGFSLIAEALLRSHLPDATWQPLVTKLGYPLGFLIVILGRQQLFTENTLTPILPLLRNKDRSTALNVLRLWGMVLASNVLGGLAIALVVAKSSLLPGDALAAVRLIGQEALQPDFGTIFLRAIFAGWLIALIVWLLPFAESGRIWVIIGITYFVGLGQLCHVVAGSITVFALAFTGDAGFGQVLAGFFVPALLGNILGGLILVAALNHAQVTAGSDVDD